MAYNKVKIIKQSLETIDLLLILAYSLTRASENTNSARVVIEKLNSVAGDIEKIRNIGTVLVKSLERERRDLVDALRGLAETFNDSEILVFEMYMFENKKTPQIAEETGLTEDYIRHIVSRINARIENEIEIKGEEKWNTESKQEH